MKLTFISPQHITEAVKYLASGGHLPYTGSDGSPNHRLMGAAWAALHGGYRGNKYQGPDRAKAIAKLKAVYKSEKMDTPQESYALDGEFLQEALRKDNSFDSIRSKVMDAVNANIRAGIDMDGDDDGPQDAIEGAYAWCSDIFPGTVVYSMSGELFQCDYTIDADGDVQLGSPSEVEMSYTPANEPDETGESFRAMAAECTQLQESAYDSAKGELTMTVIKPGMSKNKRFYPAEVLKRDYKIFEGAKMFADHQTEKQAKDQPEGSVNNWVANITNVWPESDGSVKATAVVVDPPFKAKLDRMKETNTLKDMGVSIRAIGEAHDMKKDGENFKMIESLIAARSVDFVTYAGAGGQLLAMESSNDERDVDLIGEAELRKRRPDLVTLIESSAQSGAQDMKSLELQLQESKDALAAKVAELKTATEKLAESDKTAKKAVASAELTKLLTESKLPEVSQKRIQKQFAEAVEVAGMKEAIEEEKEYLKSLGTTHVKNMGGNTQEVSETDSAKARATIVENFKNAGFSEADAKLMAAGR